MKLTIIVPVYKVEPYLRKCIDSILAQTFTDYELILVDDGSPDGCPAICDEYAEKDSRIIVIHKENGGLSSARNAGLDIAKGEYIGFVDSDDWIHPQMYEILLSAADKEDADIVQGGIRKFSENEECEVPAYLISSLETTSDSGDILIRNFYTYSKFSIQDTVWNKIFASRVFHEIRFPLGRYFEDSAILLQTLEACRTYAVVDAFLYYYLQRDSSIMHSAYNAKWFSGTQLFFDQQAYFEKKDLHEQVPYARIRCMDRYCRDYFAVSCLHPELKPQFKPYYGKFRRNILKYVGSSITCNMKKLMLVMMLCQSRTAYKICKKYFPECLYEFMR